MLGRLGDPYSSPPPVNQGQTEQDDDRDRGDWSDDMRENLAEDPDDVVEDFIDIEEPPLPEILPKPDAIPRYVRVPHNRRLGPRPRKKNSQKKPQESKISTFYAPQ